MDHLSHDIVSLVHHIELNKSTWWKETIERLIVSSLLPTTSPQSLPEIRTNIRNTTGHGFTIQELQPFFYNLISEGKIILVSGKKYIPSHEIKVKSREAIDKFISLENDVSQLFTQILSQTCDDLASVLTWDCFRDECLYSLIAHEGAQVVALSLTQTNNGLEYHIGVNQFLAKYDPDNSKGLITCIEKFVNSKNPKIHEFILRELDAHFLVMAVGLDKETICSLTETKTEQLHLQIVLDTNFLFSLMEWHDHPQNDLAHSLLALTKAKYSEVNIELLVLPITIEETRTAIALKALRINDIRWKLNLAEAAEEYGVPGFLRQYLEDNRNSEYSISISEYAEMNGNNLENRLIEKGVMLVKEDISHYSMRQDVLDSIASQIAYEKEHRSPKDRRDYQLIKHDMMAYHWVVDQRPSTLKSAFDARYWFVTLDSRLVAFDRFKCRGIKRAQVCLFPATAVQMLDFWIPRNQILENALFTSGTQLLYPASTLSDIEQVTYTIIRRLSSIKDIKNISSKAITITLADKVLRGKIKIAQTEEEEIQLIEESFVKIVQQWESDLEKERKDKKHLNYEVIELKDQNERLQEQVEGRKKLVRQYEEQAIADTEEKKKMSDTIKEQNIKLSSQESRLSAVELREEIRAWKNKWMYFPGLLIASTAAIGTWAIRLNSNYGVGEIVLVWSLAILGWVEVIVRSGKRYKERYKDFMWYRFIYSANKRLKLFIRAIFIGLAVWLITDLIKLNISLESLNSFIKKLF